MKKFKILLMIVILFVGIVPVHAEEGQNVISYNIMWRLYNPNSGEHFYTDSIVERNSVYEHGWKMEGYGWCSPSESTNPVYRMYNPNAGDHHYTLDANERDVLVTKGWMYEGIGWYSDSNQTIPVYREYNPNTRTGTHNFTTNIEEHLNLISFGWVDEGIAWYASDYGGTGDCGQPLPIRITFYSQLDSRWSTKTYGQYSFGKTGCGCTAIAMIITGITGNEVHPDIVGDYLYQVGTYNYSTYGNTGSSNIKAAEHWNVKVEPIYSYEEMVMQLQSGKILYVAENPGIFTSQGTTHALVVFGNDPNNVTVYDPNGGKTNGTYNARVIWDQRSTDPIDNDTGNTFFAYSAY